MQVTVRFFGIVSDVAKKQEQRVELSDGETIDALIRMISATNSGFAAVAKQVRAVLNGETAGRDAPLSDGDEVVFMRAIGGGA